MSIQGTIFKHLSTFFLYNIIFILALLQSQQLYHICKGIYWRQAYNSKYSYDARTYNEISMQSYAGRCLLIKHIESEINWVSCVQFIDSYFIDFKDVEYNEYIFLSSALSIVLLFLFCLSFSFIHVSFRD